MALSKNSVHKAVNIFEEILGDTLKSSLIEQRCEDNQYVNDKIIGIDKKADDGWENVFINIPHISTAQMKIWDSRKGEISNSSFCHHVQPEITRLGFY